MSQFTALATKVYKDPVTVQWANSLKQNDDWCNARVKYACIWASGTAGAGALNLYDSRGILSVTRSAQGKYGVAFNGDFNHTGYCMAGSVLNTGDPASWPVFDVATSTMRSGACSIALYDHAGASTDSDKLMLIFLGTATV